MCWVLCWRYFLSRLTRGRTWNRDLKNWLTGESCVAGKVVMGTEKNKNQRCGSERVNSLPPPPPPVEGWQRDTVETLVGRVQSDGKRGWGRGHAGSWGTGESLWQKGSEGWKAEGSMSRCTCLVKSLYHVDWRMNWEPCGNKNGGMEMRKQYGRSQIRVDEYLDHVVAARVEKQWVDLSRFRR